MHAPKAAGIVSDASLILKHKANLTACPLVKACLPIGAPPALSGAHLKEVLKSIEEPDRAELLRILCEALWSDKKGHGRPTCVWLLGHAYFYLPPGPATEALGTWFLDKLQGELSSKASRVFSHTHEALAPGSFAIFCMALRSAELARTAVPIMLQLAQRLPFDADVALQPMANLAQLLGPQLSREHMLPLLHNIIADSKKHARALLKALAQQLVRPSLLAAMTPGSSAAAPGQSAAADSAAAAANAAGNSAAAATADAAAASELLLPVLESLAAADCKEDTGAWGVADCLEKAYDHWLGAEQRQQHLLQLLPDLAVPAATVHARCVAAGLMTYAHQHLGPEHEPLVKKLLLALMADGRMVVKAAAATQLRLLSKLMPPGTTDGQLVMLLVRLSEALKATPYNKESSANSSHLGQLLMLATAVMLPEEAPAQVQWWHQLRPAFEGALRLWQYDEDDIIRVQQVALEQVERLAPHLPPAELISMCKELAKHAPSQTDHSGQPITSRARARSSACALLTICYKAHAGNAAVCRQVLAQLKLLLADSKDPDVQQRAAEQLQHIVQAAPGAAEVVGAVMPLVFGVLQAVPESEEPQAAKKKAAPKKKAAGGKKGAAASKKAAAEEGAAPARFVMDAGCAEHIKGAAAPALAGLAAHLDAAGFRQQMLPLLQAMAKDSLNEYRRETPNVLQQLAEGVQQLQKEDPIARMLYCNGDCALRLATAKQMAALAARAQQLGDHQLMLELLHLQLSLLKDPAATVSQAALQGLLQACTAVGLEAVLEQHVLPALWQAVRGTEAEAQPAVQRSASPPAAKAGALPGCDSRQASVVSMASVAEASSSGGAEKGTTGKRAASEACSAEEGEQPAAKHRRRASKPSAAAAAAGDESAPSRSPSPDSEAEEEPVDTSAGEGLEAAAAFICQLTGVLPAEQSVQHLLPLALEVLLKGRHPQPMVALLEGCVPLYKAAAQLDAAAAAQVQEAVVAAVQRVAAGEWPIQSRLYVAEAMQLRLVQAMPALAAVLPTPAVQQLLQLATQLRESHHSRAVVQGAARVLPALLQASKGAEAAGACSSGGGSAAEEGPGGAGVPAAAQAMECLAAAQPAAVPLEAAVAEKVAVMAGDATSHMQREAAGCAGAQGAGAAGEGAGQECAAVVAVLKGDAAPSVMAMVQ